MITYKEEEMFTANENNLSLSCKGVCHLQITQKRIHSQYT